MPLIAKESSGNHLAPIEPGVYVAVCYGLIDLGTHLNPKFEKETRKVLIQWEIPDCRMDLERDGETLSLPRAISERFTLSLSEKANLRRALESWRGRKFTAEELKGFDLRNVIGKACQLQVIHEPSKDGTKTYVKVAAIMALPKGIPSPRPENPISFFSFEDTAAPALPEGLPEWVAGIIQESREWKALTRTAHGASDGLEILDQPSAPLDGEDADAPIPF